VTLSFKKNVLLSPLNNYEKNNTKRFRVVKIRHLDQILGLIAKLD
jgi:hypothetical protein